jgi:hypothetical protein
MPDTPAIQQPIQKRKPGRPRKIAPWFATVAKRMADGTTLRMALMWERIQLDRTDMRKLYRNLEFRRMYRLERHLYMLNEYGRKPKTEMERLRKVLERRIA